MPVQNPQIDPSEFEKIKQAGKNIKGTESRKPSGYIAPIIVPKDATIQDSKK